MSSLIMILLILGVIYIAFTYLKGAGNSGTSRDGFYIGPYGDDYIPDTKLPSELSGNDETEMDLDGMDPEQIGFEDDSEVSGQESSEDNCDKRGSRWSESGEEKDIWYEDETRERSEKKRDEQEGSGPAGEVLKSGEEEGDGRTSNKRVTEPDCTEAVPATDREEQQLMKQGSFIETQHSQKSEGSADGEQFGAAEAKSGMHDITVEIDAEVHVDAQFPPENK